MTQKKGVSKKAVNVFWFENPKIQILIIIILGFVLFGKTVSFEYTNWDDQEYVTNNDALKNFSLSSIPDFFTEYVMGNYHPITMLSFAFEYELFGDSSFVMHFTNFILHIINSILVLLLLKKINTNWLFCFLPAMLFLVHPLHVESVAWVSERKDVLYTCFFLLAAISFFNYKNKGEKKWYILSFTLFLLSLLSKGQAVVFPLFIMALEITTDNKTELKKVFVNKILFFIVSVIFGVIAINAQASVNVIGSPTSFSFIEQIVIGLNGLFFYLTSFVFPFKQAAFYNYPTALSGAMYLKAFAGLLIFIALLFYFRKNKKIVWALLLFVITIFPVLQFLPVGSAMYADRYFYIPSIGLFIASGLVGINYLSKIKTANLFYVFIAVVFIYSVKSYAQINAWKNSFTLWEQVRINYPNNPTAWYNTGNYFIKSSKPDYQLALPYFIKATELKQNYPKAYNNLGVSYYNLGDYNKALNAYTNAFRQDSSQAEVALNVGKANDMLGNYNTAIIWIGKALAKEPSNDMFLYNMGICYFKKGSIDTSIYYYNKAVTINPDKAEYYNNMGTSYIYKKEYQTAIKMYDIAISKNVNYAEPFFNKALTYQVLGDSLKMISNLKTAADMGHAQAKQFFNQ